MVSHTYPRWPLYLTGFCDGELSRLASSAVACHSAVRYGPSLQENFLSKLDLHGQYASLGSYKCLSFSLLRFFNVLGFPVVIQVRFLMSRSSRIFATLFFALDYSLDSGLRGSLSFMYKLSHYNMASAQLSHFTLFPS